ncbi:PaaI family thioesterase [Desulfolutivibrio sulfoxidireducens]|uniref:PaaI family thioesterase n=1 Tax=Desulfolutivibrio sulfoxidireducens TaxID=2773299 RepID=UPI00159E64E8|nr:PaaI family thioesterase [Desulfolutivibrio sulfoxidireducens]QLA20241.1 hotdog fold thioesterase [Desulfolutivibrio sulfoxidireducens]
MTTDIRDIKHVIEEMIPFDLFLGMKVEEAREGYARIRLPYRPEFIGDPRRPALHGGILSTLIDTCGGTAVWASCDVKDRVATIDLRVDYLRPAPPADVIAVGEVKLLGNRVGNASVRIYSVLDETVTLAEGRGVYNIRKA